jgi:mono/diheme cytochrome c family protein
VFGFLFLLPFLDRRADRRPFTLARLPFTFGMIAIAIGVAALTRLGLNDRPAGKNLNDWGLLPIAGLEIVTAKDNTCARCHLLGGPAAPMSITRLTKDEEWLLSHMADPVAIAPGVRTRNDPAPKAVMSRFQAQAVVSYLRRLHAGAAAPDVSAEMQLAATTYANICVTCHKIGGEGGTLGPDLTLVGRRRDATKIREVIEDASMVYGESVMPVFKERLSAEQISALATYLAGRK